MSKIALSKDDFQAFWEATVRYYELDPQGVMHNANHVAFFDQAITASAADINSTWERVDTGGQGTTALQVSQTAGKFVFPVTGIYLVTLHCQIARTSTNIDLITSKIIHSTNAFVDDSTNTTLAQSILGVSGTLPKEVTALSTVVNVTSIINQRIKFTIEADDTGSELEGSSVFNNTYATFLRIAGT